MTPLASEKLSPLGNNVCARLNIADGMPEAVASNNASAWCAQGASSTPEACEGGAHVFCTVQENDVGAHGLLKSAETGVCFLGTSSAGILTDTPVQSLQRLKTMSKDVTAAPPSSSSSSSSCSGANAVKRTVSVCDKIFDHARRLRQHRSMCDFVSHHLRSQRVLLLQPILAARRAAAATAAGGLSPCPTAAECGAPTLGLCDGVLPVASLHPPSEPLPNQLHVTIGEESLESPLSDTTELGDGDEGWVVPSKPLRQRGPPSGIEPTTIDNSFGVLSERCVIRVRRVR